MTFENRTERRGFLTRTLLGFGALGLGLGGCEKIGDTAWMRGVLHGVEGLTLWAQRQFLSPHALAPEYAEGDLSPVFKANGTQSPDDAAFQALAAGGFTDYRLEIDGLVERPARLSLADLRARPAREQITRHDCVEGWSCIGKWKGARLGELLKDVGLRPAARYVVFHCFDALEASSDGSGVYYESIDLTDAFHPQTILAYEMNGATLPLAHGAPLRLRVERQLGYKMAKYIRRIEVVDSFADLGLGKGGFWEDRGYEWYAGI